MCRRRLDCSEGSFARSGAPLDIGKPFGEPRYLLASFPEEPLELAGTHLLTSDSGLLRLFQRELLKLTLPPPKLLQVDLHPCSLSTSGSPCSAVRTDAIEELLELPLGGPHTSGCFYPFDGIGGLIEPLAHR